ncbi:MAG: radical SAM protein [Ruminococcus sp.]|nr:radical SAM protein [Ruminococcus sp.]
MSNYFNCSLCPRMCRVNRYETTGFCGMGAEITAAKAFLHQWEEPCISVKSGAGTVFFSGCNLRCCYCQNNIISSQNFGKNISVERLAEIFLELQGKNADNIELVTPTHFVPDIIKALDLVKNKINIPVIYNSSGYELCETIDMLDGYIDVYLPDLKYFSPEISGKYSRAENYFEYASKAVTRMTEQVGKLKFDENGKILKGTIIRHLVLPTCRHDSMKILNWISENLDPEKYLISIMNQYTPFDFIPEKFKELKRNLTKMEYNSVVNHAAELGIKGYTQEKSSASEKYTPDFDLSGI